MRRSSAPSACWRERGSPEHGRRRWHLAPASPAPCRACGWQMPDEDPCGHDRPVRDYGAVRERIHAPDFKGATAWLNTDRPRSIRELRGQVVVLDFWT